MVSTRKLDSGSYQVRYRDPGGRHRSRSFKKKVNADKYRKEIEFKLDRGMWVDPREGKISFGDWFEQAWELAQPVKPRTACDRRARMVKHVLPLFGDTPIDRISREDVQRWVNELSASGLAPSTVKKIFETLAAPLRVAVDYERIQVSPLKKINLPRIEKKEMRFLLPEEVHLLAETIDPHFELLIRFAAETGLRIGEIGGLQGGDYQPSDRTISVKRQLLKGAPPPTYGSPKTAAGVRSMTLSEPLAKRMEALCVEGENPVFTSPGGSYLDESNFRGRYFYPAVKKAGLGHVRIHDLRHTAISLWIHNGASIKNVTERSGISSVTTALDRYGHLHPNEDRKLAERLSTSGIHMLKAE